MTYTTPGGTSSALFCDILSQPHTLIAGATGSGKSVVMNGLICNALLRLPGRQADGSALILIDPKRVEFADYADLPHTLYHAAGQAPDKWLSALRIAVNLMDQRYTEMEQRRLREFDGGDIYVFIDEWASINSRFNPRRGECVSALLRLVSEGRAAKVHVIMATQVPKSNIIPTEIRDNFVARLALMTENKLQSRVIIDRSGCETLPSPKRAGKAYGYYCLPGNDVTLYELPYTGQDEIDRITQHWHKQKRPVFRR